MINIIFLNNFAALGGGAAFTEQSTPTLDRCVFKGNSSQGDGGGLYVSFFAATTKPTRSPESHVRTRGGSNPDIVVTSCVFDSNYALGGYAYGGGLYIMGTAPVIVRSCTFGRNAAPTGGGIGLAYGSLVMENCIVSGNSQGGAVGMADGTVATLQYCDLYGNTGGDWTGSIAGQNGINGNISLDPLFVAPGTGDYHLTAASPCIDTGDPAGAPDPDGSRADMGALSFDQSFDLAASVTGGTLTLAWTSSPRAAAYWVYGAANAPFFLPGYAPGFEYRLATLPGTALQWSTTAGIGDPSANWCYLLVAVGQDGLPILPSNRVGEHDIAWDLP